MATENLQAELMALAGVAEAEVDESADSPSGVRVRLEPDADARLVGAEVQRVLASHGLRSRITDQEEDAAAAESDVSDEPEKPAPVEPETSASAEPEASASAEPEALIESPPSIPPQPLTPPPMPEESAPLESSEALAPNISEPVAHTAPTPAPEGSALQSVSVEESAAGLTVTATATDGRTVTQTAEATEEGLFDAVVATVGTLAQGTPPGLVSVTPLGANGSQAITVIIDRADGTKGAGAAVVKVSTGYAIGRATWSAIKGA